MIIVVEPGQNKITLSSFAKNGAARPQKEVEWNPQDKNCAQRIGAAVRGLCKNEKLEAVSFHLRFGGEAFGKPAKINRGFIERFSLLAASFPLYIPSVCALLEVFNKEVSAPQYAFFESSLFSGLPESERLYPLASGYASGSQSAKWGYHGIYHEAHAKMLGKNQKVVSIVLDKFTTVCAINGGKPAAISLGCTPLEGIMSEKGCGDVDPGMIVYLMKERCFSMYKLDEILKGQSGFFGMTGFDLPLPELCKLYGKNDKVTLAFDVYRNQILKYIGDYMALIKGLDAVIFAGRYTAGLGQVIYALAKDMAFLGVTLNEMPWKTTEELTCITSKDSLKHFYLNSLDEKQIIARQTRKNIMPN